MEQRSPYAPPASAVEVRDERKGSVWKALVFGLLVDYVGTTVAGLVLIMLASVLMTGNGVDSDFEILLEQPLSPVSVGLYIVGALFSVLGGYACARTAKQNEWKLGMVLAALSTLLGVLLDDEQTGIGLNLLLYSAGIAAILFGSWIGMKRNRR